MTEDREKDLHRQYRIFSVEFSDGISDATSESPRNVTAFVHQSSTGSIPEDSLVEENNTLSRTHSQATDDNDPDTAESLTAEHEQLLQDTKIVSETTKTTKQITKENTIESPPSDIFATEDSEEMW